MTKHLENILWWHMEWVEKAHENSQHIYPLLNTGHVRTLNSTETFWSTLFLQGGSCIFESHLSQHNTLPMNSKCTNTVARKCHKKRRHDETSRSLTITCLKHQILSSELAILTFEVGNWNACNHKLCNIIRCLSLWHGPFGRRPFC